MNKLLTIQIVGCNSVADLPIALAKLKLLSPDEVDITYLDNASRDRSIALVHKEIPWAKIISLPKNLGFSGAHNEGFRRCQTPYVMTLNPDVAINWPGIKLLLNEFANRQVAAIQGKLYRPPSGSRVFDSAGIELTIALNGQDRGSGQVDRGQYNHPARLTAVTGAAGIYRLAAIRQVSPVGSSVFDEDFFAYKEDVDLGWRLNKHGWQVLYFPLEQGLHHRYLKKQGLLNWGINPVGIFRRLGEQHTKYSLRNWTWLVIKNFSIRQAHHLPFVAARLLFFILLSIFYPPLLTTWLDIIRGAPKMINKRYEA